MGHKTVFCQIFPLAARITNPPPTICENTTFLPIKFASLPWGGASGTARGKFYFAITRFLGGIWEVSGTLGALGQASGNLRLGG